MITCPICNRFVKHVAASMAKSMLTMIAHDEVVGEPK